jgi:hypothetical protein
VAASRKAQTSKINAVASVICRFKFVPSLRDSVLVLNFTHSARGYHLSTRLARWLIIALGYIPAKVWAHKDRKMFHVEHF